jgi:hypothetical protein
MRPSSIVTGRLGLGLAALLALAIWLPLPHVAPAGSGQRAFAFTGRSDPAADVAGLVARSLLEPGRASAKAATSAPPAPADASARFVLRGLARVDHVDVAVFEDRTTAKFIRVQRGQDLGGWYLADVRDTTAILMNADGAERPMPLAAKPR